MEGFLQGAKREGERWQHELGQRKFTVNARANREAIVKVVKYWSRGLERGRNLPLGTLRSWPGQLGSSLLGAGLGGSGLGESSEGARALQALQEVWSWAGDKVPAGGGHG